MAITYCASRKLQERGFTPPKESYSQAFSEENRTAAGWLSGESHEMGAEGERKLQFPNLSGKRTVNTQKADLYLFFCACRFTGVSPVNLFRFHIFIEQRG